ncbi:hypothetical protein R6Z07M_009602 [Ovis aries]
MILWCTIEMPNISYAWKELKEQLGEDIDSKVKGMVFLKGKQLRVTKGSVIKREEAQCFSDANPAPATSPDWDRLKRPGISWLHTVFEAAALYYCTFQVGTCLPVHRILQTNLHSCFFSRPPQFPSSGSIPGISFFLWPASLP